MGSSVAKDIYEGLKKVMTVQDRIAELTESVKYAHVVLQNHTERVARREAKIELLEHSLSRPRHRLPEKSS